MKIPLRLLPSRYLHHVINPIAWKIAPTGNSSHWIWKINNFVSKPWVDYYVYQKTGKTRQQWQRRYKQGGTK